jgi:hypothetical protein
MMMTRGPGFTLIVLAPLELLIARGSADESTMTSVARLSAILEWPLKATERKPALSRGATYLTRMPITPATEDVVPVSVVPARAGAGRPAVAAPLPAALVSTTVAASPAADSPARHRRAIERRRARLPGEPGSSLVRAVTSTSLDGHWRVVPDRRLGDGPPALARIVCDLDVNAGSGPAVLGCPPGARALAQ